MAERLGFGARKIADAEILDDYLAVRLLLERLRGARKADGKGGVIAIEAIEMADTCLDQVEHTPWLEEKWSYINRANALLAFACTNRAEQAACMLRLKNLLPLLSGFKERLPEPFNNFAPTDADLKQFNPLRAFEVLETAAQGWHLVNEQNAFSTRLWRRARWILLTLLLIGVVGMEVATPRASGEALSLDDFRYFWAVAFGTLGGALSSLLGARDALFSATTYRVGQSQAWMRILLGGVGAFVVILTIETNLVFREELSMAISAFGGLALVSIAAGFSERLFLAALNRIAGTVGEPRQAAGKPAAETAGEKGKGQPAAAPLDWTGLAELARETDEEDETAQSARAGGERRATDLAAERDAEDAKEQSAAARERDARLAALAEEADEEDRGHQGRGD